MPKRKKEKIKKGRNARQRRPKEKVITYFDYNMLAVVIILISFGLVMLYSASAYEAVNDINIGDDMYYFKRQAFFSVFALFIAYVVSRIDYHIPIMLSPAIFIVAMALMTAVQTPLGVTVNGARRWLKIGVQFQPSEIAKIAIICIMPYIVLRVGKKLRSWKAVAVLVSVGLLQGGGAYFLTDNLSTGLIIMGISVIVLYLAYPKSKPFYIALAAAITAITLGVLYIDKTMQNSDRFRLQRIITWLHPEKNAQDGGYQVLQGLYAIGSGGFFGKGLGNSTQKLATIPEAQNDMIFSIVCEELGVFGAVILLILFGYLLYRLVFIAQNAPDLYGTLLVAGIFGHVSLQVILNICVVLNLIPTTGVTLPFVSYGGTSVIFLMGEIGMALNVSRNISFGEKKETAAGKPKAFDKTQVNN
ncbi:MAG: putative peptidoglycan glycosyltransferase FtsW [Eubacteriales bacterium]|nr:putative peptidoglycan glycosyltransferase FtsW [Eubacteriales bacterium]